MSVTSGNVSHTALDWSLTVVCLSGVDEVNIPPACHHGPCEGTDALVTSDVDSVTTCVTFGAVVAVIVNTTLSGCLGRSSGACVSVDTLDNCLTNMVPHPSGESSAEVSGSCSAEGWDPMLDEASVTDLLSGNTVLKYVTSL